MSDPSLTPHFLLSKVDINCCCRTLRRSTLTQDSTGLIIHTLHVTIVEHIQSEEHVTSVPVVPSIISVSHVSSVMLPATVIIVTSR